MENKLDNLIYIYSVDTSSFYNKKENELNKKLIQFKYFKSQLAEIVKPLNKFKLESNKILNDEKLTEIEKNKKLESIENEIIKFINDYMVVFKDVIDEYLLYDDENNGYIINQESLLFKSCQYIENCINEAKTQLDIEAENHIGKRILRDDALTDSNKISLFESTLTRSLGINDKELSIDIIVVRAYRYAIFEDIVKNGFRYKGENYEYFSSSAGQIRTKKSCFIRSRALTNNMNQIKNKLMCGLSVDKINRKGGINQNKFQAYLSLTNSASKQWISFNIDKCIVVDDMELEVEGLVDYINHETYKIKRKTKKITINFMDGAGIILPSISDKAFQFRMPWFKGLLIPFDFRNFIFEHEDADWIVKDIYGKEWNIFKDDIRIIFTKSQFKLNSYYRNWDEYKTFFKKFNCEASVCKVEEEVFEDKPINYQMIQSLSFTNEELKQLASKTSNDILSIGQDKETMLRLLGADESNTKKNYFQKALAIYPELLNDVHSKQAIKDRKKSLVNEARSGKILLEGTKRAYISPDLYAFSEWLFAGIKEPDGLLRNGEVSCKLFKEEKLDILRSPHLFREHAVRQNVTNDKTEKWFISNCIYTSVHDMISKLLMFDVDGDDALIIKNKLFVERAETKMKKTVPLDYTLATAKKSKISNDNIVKSLKAAYSKNIGEISNLITKIWNSDKTLKKKDINLIEILCMENNQIIDYAKTLWMSKRPKKIKKRIKEYNKMKTPYFFQFAKDKEVEQTEKINNSTMNRLTKVIPNKRINFVKVAGKFDYKNLMRNKRHKNDDELSRNIIDTYIELDRNKSKDVKKQIKENDKMNSRVELEVYKKIRKQLLQITNNPNYVTDVLVKYLFDEINTEFKDTLWRCFGKEIVRNLEYNVLGIKRCLKCKTEIKKINKKKYCDECAKEKQLEWQRISMNKLRNKNNVK